MEIINLLKEIVKDAVDRVGGIFMAIIFLLIIILIFYGIFWFFKTISYQVFYESMVKDTIIEMVKPEYLK